MARHFTAQISAADDSWTIHVPEIDVRTRARDLAEVEPRATDLIATTLDIEPESIQLDIERPDRIISVITAVHQPHIPFLHEAYESLRAQELPDEWTWQWAMQIDGDGSVPSQISGDTRVRVGRNRPSGPGVTRTMALANTAGHLVRTLDADDQLLPGALAQDITVLSANRDVGWTVAPALDLRDGDLSRWDKEDPDPGRLAINFVVDSWRATGWDHLTVLPSTMCIRRTLLIAIGGWMSLPTSEDTGLLAASSALAPGWFHSEPGNIYRKHPDQLTATAEHRSSDEAIKRRMIILERVAAIPVVADSLLVGQDPGA